MNRRQRTGFTILFSGILIGILTMYIFAGKADRGSRVNISHNMVVEKIERLGNLEVIKYSIQDIMEYEKVRRWLPNAKTALIVSGEVTGCINLTKLQPGDIYTSGDSIRLALPSPEICHVQINHSQSRIYDMQYGLWESAEIVDEAYRHAEEQLRERAATLDIDSKSRDNAVNLLRPILEAMGFRHVLITFREGKELSKELRN